MTNLSPDQIEERSKALYKHPRVSLDDIKDFIAGEYYTTADKAFGNVSIMEPLKLLTICVLVLRNGFTVIGVSAPASPDNFDEAYGRSLAKDNAIKQIWPLMGFSLRDRLSGGYRTISEGGDSSSETDLEVIFREKEPTPEKTIGDLFKEKEPNRVID